MAAITRRRDGVNGDPTIDPAGVVAEAAPALAAGGSYTEERRLRIRRHRLVVLVASIPIWALSAVPLARDIGDGRDGAWELPLYLGVAAGSLALASLLRVAYVVLAKRRHFWSPWVFVVAAIFALAGYSVQTAGEPPAPLARSA